VLAVARLDARCLNSNETDFWKDSMRIPYGLPLMPLDLVLIEVFVDKSREAVTWLKDRVSVDLLLLAQLLGGHSHKRTHRPSNGMAGAEIIYGMQKAVREYEKTRVCHSQSAIFKGRMTGLQKRIVLVGDTTSLFVSVTPFWA
jgi:succinate dehydrogenase/fumarate reductase flavoprotein subunit